MSDICNQVEVIYEYAIEYKKDDFIERCEINDMVYKVKKIDKSKNYDSDINSGDCIKRYKIAYDDLIAGKDTENPKFNFIDIDVINANFDKFTPINKLVIDNSHQLINILNYITLSLLQNDNFRNNLRDKINKKRTTQNIRYIAEDIKLLHSNILQFIAKNDHKSSIKYIVYLSFLLIHCYNANDRQTLINAYYKYISTNKDIIKHTFYTDYLDELKKESEKEEKKE